MTWLVPICRAQSTFASLTGSVTDSQGLAINGASIRAVHTASGFVTTVASNGQGVYTLAQMKQGEYRVEVRFAGFRTFEAQNLILEAMNIRRLDVRLEPGSVENSVQVTAGVALIETDTGRISDTKNAEVLKSIPLNSRALWGYVALNPGVAQATSSSSYRRFSGSRLNQSDATIDGITTNNGMDGGQVSPLVNYIESFEEVRVDLANNTAEFANLGQVTVVSRSGSNRVRGTAFDYYSTPMFRARNPFALERTTGVTHFPGYSIGGPVMLPKIYDGRNKTFFFHSYELTKGSQVATLFNPTVATPNWRQGNFTGSSIRDPSNGNVPFPGNQIPAARISGVARKIQDRFFPLPNFGDPNQFQSQNFRQILNRPRDPENYITGRIDHRFSDKSSLFGRYTYNRAIDRRYEGALPAIGQRDGRRDTRAFTLSHSYVFRPNLLNEARWGYAFNDSPRKGAINGKQLIAELGITGLVDDLPDREGLLVTRFSQLGLTGIAAPEWRTPGFSSLLNQFQDNLSFFRGKHSVKMGIQLGRVGFSELQQSANQFGNITFSNRFTGHPYADFLLGIPTSSVRAFAPLRQDTVRWTYDFFVAEEYKVSRKLTLTMGLRYEFHPPPKEKNGLISVFDIVSGRIIIPDGTLSKVSPLMPRGYVDIVEAGKANYTGGALVRTDRNNFAPRLGAAFRPWGNKTVFRAGFGMFYDIVPRGATTIGTPFNLSEPVFTNPIDNPTVIFPRIFPSSAGGLSSVNLPSAVREDLRIPFSMQYNFTIEQEWWRTGFRLSYIGTNTRQGEYRIDVNQPVPDARAFVDKPRPFPRYPAISYLTNGAGHQYNAFTAEVKRNLTGGLHLQASYQLARDIGDLERGDSPEDAYDRRRERGVWADIPTHRLNWNFVLPLPFGKGKRYFASAGKLAGLVVGGWQISGIYVINSGQFLTPLWTGPDPTGTAFTASRTPAQVTIRPNALRNGNLPTGERSVDRWFDVGAFTAPSAGAFGNSARGVIKGPGIHVFQSGVYKTIPLGERVMLRGELTGQNIFNHPNYSAPGMNINAPANAGVITDVGGVQMLDPSAARSLRLGVRLEW